MQTNVSELSASESASHHTNQSQRRDVKTNKHPKVQAEHQTTNSAIRDTTLIPKIRKRYGIDEQSIHKTLQLMCRRIESKANAGDDRLTMRAIKQNVTRATAT
jgi:ABC-type microcin C transport system permease subunit YejB